MIKLITYHNNDALDIDKPTKYTGKDFDFNSLTPRNFEVLLYRFFTRKIENCELSGKFDKIALMSGVRDGGQDCALFYDDNQVGLIQCKKYANNLGKKEIVEEVLKFVLYSIVDKHIFCSGTEKQFTYYFAVSTGFTRDANTYIGTFCKSITADKDLKNYVEELINKYSSLQHLTYEEIENELMDKLAKIDLKPIYPNDLQGWLRSFSDILLDFFEVDKVVDRSLLDPITEELAEIKTKIISPHNIENITTEITDASKVLESIPSTFSNTSKAHIDRYEVHDIYNWIVNEPQKNKSLALVVGTAGCGKSVILRDVLLKCKSENIPVLGIKSDRQNADTLKGLTDKLNFSHPIIDSIRQVAFNSERVAILIDQIDALSQYLSAKRDSIDTYAQLIDILKTNPKIRIIISSRKFDLDNDPDIKKFAIESTVFHVGLLTEEQVMYVLQDMGTSIKAINKNLIELLKLPVHLELFCRICIESDSNFNEIQNTVDLYGKFWDEIILKKDNPKIKTLLFNISKEMYSQQYLEVGEVKYKDDYWSELNLLKSEGILISNDGMLTFFHQSFYDYVFAKGFIAEDGDILKYIEDNCQLISIRAGLKIILSYLRDYDTKKYLSTIGNIMTDEKYKFHIKHLAYSILGSEINPTAAEISFVEECVLGDIDKLKQFLVLCSGLKWAHWIFENNILSLIGDDEPYDTRLSVIYTNLNSNTSLVINYLKDNRHLPKFSDEHIIEILSALKVWSDESLEFIKSLIPSFSLNNERHIHLLLNIGESNPQFVLENIDKISFILKKRNAVNSMDGYYQNKLIDLLIEKAPFETCEFIYEVINNLIIDGETKSYRSGNFITDKYFDDFYYCQEGEDGDGIKGVLNKFIKQLSFYAQKQPDIYSVFYDKIKDSEYYTWNLVLAISLGSTPSTHIKKIVALCDKALNFGEYGLEDTLHYQLWLLLKNSFNFLDQESQTRIADIINHIKLPWERKFSKWKDCKLLYPSIGYTSYYFLRALPREYIKSNQNLSIRFGELMRKYGDKDRKWDCNRPTMASLVGAPLTSIAYERMNDQQWKESFLKYNSEYRRNVFSDDDYLKGDIEQHSSMFKSVVKNNPERYFNLVRDIIFDKVTDLSYKISGLEGLVESEFNCMQIYPLYEHLSQIELCSSHTLHMMWMARKLCVDGALPEDIFNYVIDTALKSNENKEDRYDINYCISNVQGAAISPIIMSYQNPLFHDRIFNTLGQIIETGRESSRLSILLYIAYLNHIDVGKSFNIFKSCLILVNDETVKVTSHSIKYYYRYFRELNDFYRQAIETCKEKDNKRNMSIFISHQWLANEEKANDLLDFAISNWGTDVIDTLIDVAFANISNPSYTDKCFELLCRFIDSDQDEIKNAYSCGFLRNEDIDLMLISEFIGCYIKSKSFDISRGYFFDYLFHQSKKYPNLVLDIINSIGFAIGVSGEKRYREDDKLIKVILGSINSLRKDKQRYRIMATDIFDSILRNSPNYHYLINELDSTLR